ncbi:MAG: hypothetical protein QXV83_01885 [Candidatus Anstonellaceae archaeon]
MQIVIPGKILFYGQYAVLEKGFSAFSFAVLDKKNNGVNASFKLGRKRIISKQFGLNFEPKKFDVLVSYPYLFAEYYLKQIGEWKKDVEICLSNSKMFGPPNFKSGLGSSAAATVAIVKSLFLAQGLDIKNNLEIIHKISQYAYAAFSRKLSSGYDIATATYATSIEYKRFDPKLINIQKIFDMEYFFKTVNKNWNSLTIFPLSLPHSCSIVFFNFLGGSTSTSSNVKVFLKLKEKKHSLYFEFLRKQNEAEKKAIRAILKEDYSSARFYTHQAREFLNYLSLEAKKMSNNFDLIEPPKISRLVEEVEKLDGVIAGRSPGAGGKDGIAFLVKKDFNNSKKIIQLARKLGLKLKEIKLNLVI